MTNALRCTRYIIHRVLSHPLSHLNSPIICKAGRNYFPILKVGKLSLKLKRNISNKSCFYRTLCFWSYCGGSSLLHPSSCSDNRCSPWPQGWTCVSGTAVRHLGHSEWSRNKPVRALFCCFSSRADGVSLFALRSWIWKKEILDPVIESERSERRKWSPAGVSWWERQREREP